MPASATTTPAAARIAEMTALTAAISPGDWYWGGNTDMGDLELRTRIPGKGACIVLGHMEHHYTREEAEGRISASDISEEDRQDCIRNLLNNPERLLAFGNPDGRYLIPARDTAIYAVARNQGLPDDTPRTHPEVYRADVIGSRHANAAFMEQAPRHMRAATAALSEIHEAVEAVLAADPDDPAARAVAAILESHLGDTEKSEK